MRVCLETFYSATFVAIVTSSVLTLTDNFDILRQAPCKRTQHCGCYMLGPFAHPVARCCILLGVVVQSLKSVKFLSQKLTTFLLFRDCRSVAQQCWIRLNIVRATHAHYTMDNSHAIIHDYTWSLKSYRLYPSHDALQVPTLLRVVASLCPPLPTRT